MQFIINSRVKKLCHQQLFYWKNFLRQGISGYFKILRQNKSQTGDAEIIQ